MKTHFTLILTLASFLCTSQDVIFNASDTLAKALEYGEQRQWEQANMLYHKVIKDYEQIDQLPEEAHMRAYRRLGIDSRAEGLEDSARYFLRRSTELYLLNPIKVFSNRAIDNFNQMVYFYGQRSVVDSAMAFCHRGIQFVKENEIPANASILELHGNLSFGYQLKGEFSKSFAEAERGLQASKLIENIPPGKVSQSYLRYAQSLTKASMCSKAQRYLDTAFLVLSDDTLPHVVKRADLLIRKAQCYNRQNMHELKLNALDGARLLLESEVDSNHAKFAFLYHFYASHYQQIRDYERAMVYRYKVIELLEEAIARTPIANTRHHRLDLGTAHSNLGDLMISMGQYDEAVPHFQISLDTDLGELGKSGETINSYNNFGRLYFVKGDFDKGLEYYSEAEKIALDHFKESPAQAVYFYNDLGTEYFSVGDPVSAHQYYLKALEFHIEKVSNAERLTTYFNLAKSAAELDSLELAENYFRKVITGIQVDIDNPVKIVSGREERALRSLMGLAKLKTDPDSALYYLLPAHFILQKLLKEAALGDEAQLRLREIAYPLYQEIQFAYIRLGKTRQALQYCDVTKSGLLRQRWIETEALEEADVPADLLNLKRSLQYELTRILQSSSDAAHQKTRGFAIQAQIDSIDREISIAFPKYFEYLNNAKLEQTVYTDPSESIICFFAGTDSTLVYVLHGKSLEVFVLSTDTLNNAVEAFNASVSQESSKSVTNYKVHSANLSDLLSAPIANAMSVHPEKMTIVPDGPLSFTPFELLSFDSTEEMLLTQFPVRYLTSLGGRNRVNSRDAEKQFAGFAPTYADPAEQDTITDAGLANLVRSGYYNLPGAASEVEDISSLMNGDSFLDSAATKSEFIRLAPQYQILHMSMHAMADFKQPGQSRLLFTPRSENKLISEMTTSEIRSLKFNADLIVLSACQTNVGQLKKGEGVMSLSRAFSYAGVPSSVTSLWKVPDASTSQIMKGFYGYLLDGETKDNALRLAKLDYLSNVKFEVESHPRYWAGFVLTGDTSAIQSIGYMRYWLLAGFGVILLLILGRKLSGSNRA